MVDAFNMTVMVPAGLTYLSESGGNGSPGNLITNQPGERTYFTAGNQDGFAGWVRFDAQVPVTVNQLALLYTDLGPGDVAIFIGSTDPSFPDGGYEIVGEAAIDDLGLSQPLGYRHAYLNKLSSAVTYRYWQVQVRCPTGAVRSAGRLAFGYALQVEFNPDLGSTSWGYEEAPEPDTLDSGVTILEELAAAPYFEFALTWTNEAEMEYWWNQHLGPRQWRRQPVLVVRRPDAHAFRHSGIFWGILRLQPFVAAQFDMYEVNGKIRSMV